MVPDAAPSPADADPLLGQTLGGHYRIQARLGQGAMGVVYRARHTLLDQDHAVKLLHPELIEDPEVRRRFLLEARSLTAFTHKHAVQVRHCGEDRGRLFLVMDLVAGESLAQRLAREGALDVEVARTIVVQVLEALEEAHEAGIVHRDVKPANILVEHVTRPDGSASARARVVDFGLARWVGPHAEAQGSPLASQGGRVVGTVAYMAPEQLRCEEVDGRADLFGVGAVLYEALTGERPFPGESLFSTAARVIAEPPRPWSALDLARVPVALRAVVERALEKDPARRFPTAAAMAEALREVPAGAAPSVASPAPAASAVASQAAPSFAAPLAFEAAAASISTSVHLPPLTPPPRRAPWRWVVAALALLGVGGLVWALVGRREAPEDVARVARAAAEDHLARGQLPEAYAGFQRALAALPEDPEARLGRAETLILQGDEGAKADLEVVARLRPQDPRVHLLRAALLARITKDPARALEELGRGLFLDRGSVEVRAARALLALEQGDLELADQDVAALEASAPQDPRGPALRARVVSARVRDLEPAAQLVQLEEALAAARKASALDPRWSGGPRALASIETTHTILLRGLARDADSAQHAGAALEAATEAVRRAQAYPLHLRQGQELPRILADRAGAAYAVGRTDLTVADLDQAVLLAPRDAFLLSLRAFHLQQAGEHERAFADYERLYDITQQSDPLFRLGFGVQLLGQGEAARGELEEARQHYLRAEATYTRGVVRFPKAIDMLIYRGEVRTRLGVLAADAAARAAKLAAAHDDLEQALAIGLRELPSGWDDGESLLRRAELLLLEDRAADALRDLRHALASRKDRTPRYFFRHAQAALACAQAEPLPPGVGSIEDLLTEALASARRAQTLGSARHLPAAQLEAEIHLARARRAPDAATRAARLAEVQAVVTTLQGWGTPTPQADPEAQGEAAQARAIAGYLAALAREADGDTPGALVLLREALSLREAERKAGRWALDARWYDALARLCERVGDAAGAQAARAKAVGLPR